ncbi:putative late blight resistance protein homolog R1B-16 [Solanum dulcamara]|uniref:putative late blight resistance protein homolog R1B-16 n=1 Tax=Solanum dulcamara TaxID=45834 RepID=UPI0024852DA9|nr:putative late blight resistance protein homolog R1B-16 [Solanum dulcamara]
MAYAAITCLMRTIQRSMQLTGCDHLQPFYEKLESLRAIMEKPWKATDDLEAFTSLEAEIAEVAYSAEDMVASKSRNVLFAQKAKYQSRAFWELSCSLEQEVERIDSFIMQWLTIWNWYSKIKDLKEQKFSLAASIPEHAVEQPENIMVGLETEFEMMLDQVAGGERELEVVTIVGMGGIGKTTLATKLYSDPHIMSHFDILAKATVSQEHCVRNVLLALLSSASEEPDDQLADQLQKLLKCKRYLVVIDDIWTTGAWDDIRRCFPDCNNGSRILLTTRNVEVAEYASSGKPPYHMRLMDFDESWNLLYEKVFAKDSFPPEFEQLGKQIALKCGGLPLAIIVIAGLLSKTGKTLDEWQSVAENVSSAVSTDLESQCMKVLALSYHHLPSHLKPCFLYFAIFPEDSLVFVDKLVKLWVAEGFLKVEEMENIEEVAEKYLTDLVDRSLISISHSIFDGKKVSCGMHDVTREICLREARNVNFVNVLRGTSDQNPCSQSMQCSCTSRGRISIHNEEELIRYRNSEPHSIIMFGQYQYFEPELPFNLVRVLDLASIVCTTFPSGILSLTHLRYLALSFYLGSKEEVPSSILEIPPSISRLCYMETFILSHTSTLILPSEILRMPQLRHLSLSPNYFYYHGITEESLVLKNLQSLSGLNPRYCTGFFFILFPNLKELQILGFFEDFSSCKDLHDLFYLDQLEKLEFVIKPLSVFSEIVESPLLLPPPWAFPLSLKNLAFKGHFSLPLKDLSIVGKLLKLESLKLESDAFIGDEWEVAEEGFPHLKFLLLKYLDIRHWRASSDHFPCLERLIIENCSNLDSIPQDFADITTLALIHINYCAESVGKSAKQIQWDIQENYGGSIEVHVRDNNSFSDDEDDFDEVDFDVDDFDDDDDEGSAPELMTSERNINSEVNRGSFCTISSSFKRLRIN